MITQGKVLCEIESSVVFKGMDLGLGHGSIFKVSKNLSSGPQHEYKILAQWCTPIIPGQIQEQRQGSLELIGQPDSPLMRSSLMGEDISNNNEEDHRRHLTSTSSLNMQENQDRQTFRNQANLDPSPESIILQLCYIRQLYNPNFRFFILKWRQ